MTNEEYQSLLKWCRDKKNHGTPLFITRHTIKEIAKELQQTIRYQKKLIKNAMFWLEMTQHEEKRNKMFDDLEAAKDRKREAMKQFAELEIPK